MVRSFSPSFNFPAGVFPCSYVVMSKKHVTDLASVFLFFTRAMVKMVQWFHLSVVALVGSSQLTLELDWALPALGSGSSLNNDPCNSGFFKFFPSSNLGPNPPTHHYLDTCFAGLENPWVSCGAAKPSAWQSNRAAFTVGLGPASQWARIQGWFLAVFCSFNIESWQYGLPKLWWKNWYDGGNNNADDKAMMMMMTTRLVAAPCFEIVQPPRSRSAHGGHHPPLQLHHRRHHHKITFTVALPRT